MFCQVDVFTLGRTYLKLAQELYINLPAVGKTYIVTKLIHIWLWSTGDEGVKLMLVVVKCTCATKSHNKLRAN